MSQGKIFLGHLKRVAFQIPQYGTKKRSALEVYRHVSSGRQRKLHPKLEIDMEQVAAGQDAVVTFEFSDGSKESLVTSERTANQVFERLDEKNFVVEQALEEAGKL